MRLLLEFKSSALFKCVFLVATASSIFGCGGRVATENPNSTTGQSPESRGRQIVDEYLKRDFAPFRKSRIRFIVTQEGEPEKIYEIDSWRKRTADQTTTLIQIVAPPEDSGTSTLTLESKDKKTVVVTYAASRKEFRETDTKKMFFGGLTAGELLGEWDKFDYKFLGEKDSDGVKAFEVEGKLKPDADSVVSQMTALFRSDNYIPAELHFFGADGREIRTYKTAVIKEDPVHPYAERVEVDNNVYKAHIVIEILAREYPARIDDSMFEREKLKQSMRK